MAAARTFLFTGKGGSGKTTCAAAFAYALARRGRNVLAVSLDQAHNLGDILGVELGPRPKDVVRGLRAAEADLTIEARAILHRTEDLIRRRYRYLTVASMEPLLELLGESPGAEEHAAAGVLVRMVRETERTGETLVVDLPPSGQAWRILALPALTARWCRSLMKLRRRLLDRRDTLDRILGRDGPSVGMGFEPSGSDPKDDPVTGVLADQEAVNQAVADALADQAAARIIAVTTPARLALIETRRLIEKLGSRGMALYALVLNRAGSETLLDPDPGIDPAVVLRDLPNEPSGLDDLAELAPLLAPLYDDRPRCYRVKIPGMRELERSSRT